MDLNQLLIFAKVAEYQSFTKAAQELMMEKSTVSTKVSQLEDRLGARLLNRTTRSVTLTEAGEGYYHYCQQIVENVREADHFAETLTTEPQGLLRITAPLDFGHILVRTLVRPFMDEYQKVQLELFLTERQVDLVKERFDVALRIGTSAFQDSSLIAKQILSIHMSFFASPDFLRQYGIPESINELNNYDFIVFAPEKEKILKVQKGNVVYQFKRNGRFKVNDMLACKEAALSGLGIAALPTRIVQEETNEKRLIPILSDYSLPKATLFAIYPSRQWMPRKLKVFVEYLDTWGMRLP
jgi:DNA-binding transcriptional LysR family regulator